MRKILGIILVMFFIIGYAQEQSANRFEEAEQEHNTDFGESPTSKEPEVAYSGGNPPGEDDLPIDDYIPLLLLTGVGIIVYTTYRKKQMTKS